MKIPYKLNPFGQSEDGGGGDDEFGIKFTATSPNARIRILSEGSPNVAGLQCKIGLGKWTSYTIGTLITVANIGDFVKFRNTENTLSTSSSNYVKFQILDGWNCEGNIMSMLNYSESCSNYCFCKLFYNCQQLYSAPELPATTLAENCYRNMFYRLQFTDNCSIITSYNYCWLLLLWNVYKLYFISECSIITRYKNK